MTRHQTLTPAERAAAHNAMPDHVVFISRGGRALITQMYGRVLSQNLTETRVSALNIMDEYEVRVIPTADVLEVKTGGRFSHDEVLAIHAEHAHRQTEWAS